MFDRSLFESERKKFIEAAARDSDLVGAGLEFLRKADHYNYGYFWKFMGFPVIQMPADIVLTQELLWDIKPEIVIEAGVAWGGSLIMYAAFQELYGKGRVFGIDTVIPDHNRVTIMGTPVSHRITLIEGSSTDSGVFHTISNGINAKDRILLILDSNHSEKHVLEELRLWTPLLKPGDFLIVSDTVVEDIPPQTHRPRPWGPGNNPGTALHKFLEESDRFSYKNEYSGRAINSFNPSGYLECVK